MDDTVIAATSFPPPSLQRVFLDYATTPRVEFLENLDLGVPLDKTVQGAEDALILYNSKQALPKNTKHNQRHFRNSTDAVMNCQTVKIVLVDPHDFSHRARKPECLALVPQWSSPHIYKYMRLPEDDGDKNGKGKLDPKLPLRYVSRTHGDAGKNHAYVPSLHDDTLPSLEILSEYVHELPHAQQRLRALLNSTHKKDPLIVMTCNKGQSELLVNFVCSARSRNLPLDRIILFATDTTTYKLCQDLHLSYCYYDSTLFGDIPEEAAGFFGDNTFSKVMKAKVYCVHLIMTLGYDVLFMDVDVIWYKNPLEYYRTVLMEKQYDLVFQDDGARTMRYAPYSPNSGFYFVRNHPKTMFLFGELLKMGDTIARYHSHQHALSQLVNEHVGWTGIRVKVHKQGFGNPFPGGFEFNTKPDFMKDFLMTKESKQDPYIWHMCWTEGKEHKIKFYEQMGQWHVRNGFSRGECKGLNCCQEPEPKCNFRDYPSVIPCKDSPPLDEDDPGDSFWSDEEIARWFAKTPIEVKHQ
jgi:hypothetical protein